MEKVQRREGLVCVCAECKRVMKVVEMPAAEGEPLVSHGICPECAERLSGAYLRKTGSGPRETPLSSAGKG